MKKTKPPVQKNEIIEIPFTDLTHDGTGVGKVDGYPLFVPGVLPGEKGKVLVVKTKRQYGYGKLLELKKTSPNRVEPRCPIFSRCGGCQLQHLSYESQLHYKRNLVKNALERIGGFKEVTVHPTIGMEDPWRYRNKAQVPIGEQEGGLVAGFYQRGSHRIVDMESCLIQQEQNDFVVQAVKRILDQYGIPAYDEKSHRGLIRHVIARYGANTGEVMVVLVTREKALPERKNIIRAIISAVPAVKSICQNVNPKRTNTIFGEETRVLWGREVIYDTIGPIRFAISPRSFFQVNPVQTEKLYRKALEYADLSGSETVIDAYCGIGTISLFLAQKARAVYGVEIVPEAVADARRNAELNGLKNVTFTVGEAERVMPEWSARGINPDVIVVDPPRKGCDHTLLETMLAMKPRRLVYVSCNPATLARDARILSDGGYQIIETQPVDMFPQTVHVECCALFVKQ